MTLLKIWIVVLAATLSTVSFAESADEIREKIKKLEAQIEAGTDPALVNPYIEQFRAELTKMESGNPAVKPAPQDQPKAESPPQPVAPKKLVAAQKPAPQKVLKKARATKPAPKRLNKRERQLAFLNTTSVEDRLDRFSALHRLISSGKEKLHSVRNSGRDWQSIKQEVSNHQDQIVEWQREYDLLSESLGPLRAIASFEGGEAKSSAEAKTPTLISADRLDFSGRMRFRHENQNATGYDQAVTSRGREGVSLFRLRGNFLYRPHDKLTVGFTPQAVKNLGGDEFTTSDATSNSQNESSGNTYQPQVDFFEAYVDYKFADNLSVKLGRQELSYGDDLVIGALPWQIDGRSFDALKIRYTHGKGMTDVFVSQISDDATLTNAADDSTFYGLYSQLGEMAV
ncbi:MAG: alginate export family protein, partial [Pseudomonadota bacterium]